MKHVQVINYNIYVPHGTPVQTFLLKNLWIENTIALYNAMFETGVRVMVFNVTLNNISVIW